MKITKLISNYKNKIIGGKGDKTDPETLDKKQLSVGVLVEMEHTSNPNIAFEIAVDHLAEIKDYYTKLVKSGIVDEPKAIAMYKKLFSEK